MKKLLIPTLVALGQLLYGATNEADFVKGVDLTSTNYINASLLNQLVDEATPAAKRGLIIRQSSTPDTTNNAHLTNYIWLDTSTSPSTLKRWNTAGTWDDFSQPVGTNSVNTSNLVNGSVTTVKIQDLAVEEAKISAGAVTTSKIADSSVTRAKIIDGAIDVTKITNGAVTSDKILDSTIATADLADNSVASNKVVSGSITYDKLVPGIQFYSTNLLDNIISNAKMQTDSITSSNIVDGTIVTNDISTNVLDLLPHGRFYVSTERTNFTGNISGVTKVGTGAHMISFASGYASTNYQVIITGHGSLLLFTTTSSNTTAKFNINIANNAGTPLDQPVSGVIYKPIP